MRVLGGWLRILYGFTGLYSSCICSGQSRGVESKTYRFRAKRRRESVALSVSYILLEARK